MPVGIVVVVDFIVLHLLPMALLLLSSTWLCSAWPQAQHKRSRKLDRLMHPLANS